MTKSISKIQVHALDVIQKRKGIPEEQVVFENIFRLKDTLSVIQDQFRIKRESANVQMPNKEIIRKAVYDLLEITAVLMHIFRLTLPSLEDIDDYVNEEVEASTAQDGILASLYLNLALTSITTEFYARELGENVTEDDIVGGWFYEAFGLALTIADLSDITASEIVADE